MSDRRSRVSSLASRHEALLLLAWRAAPLYVLARIVATMTVGVGAAMMHDPMTTTDAIRAVNPMTPIVFSTIIGALDVRRRREWLLWANLGYGVPVVLAVFDVVALAGEILVAAVW